MWCRCNKILDVDVVKADEVKYPGSSIRGNTVQKTGEVESAEWVEQVETTAMTYGLEMVALIERQEANQLHLKCQS